VRRRYRRSATSNKPVIHAATIIQPKPNLEFGPSGSVVVAPKKLRLRFVPLIAKLPHAEALVWMVKAALTALVPETVALEIAAHPFVSVGLLVTDHAMVPV
jgi:hypothetical protein